MNHPTDDHVHTADIAVIVPGHAEGTLAHSTYRALAAAIVVAQAAGLGVEVVGVLDNADELTTRLVGESLATDGVVGSLCATRVERTTYGDPGLARNHGVRNSSAPWICMLDGDNLVNPTWLRDAWRAGTERGVPCVVHPEHLLIFQGRWEYWPQPASDDPGFNAGNFHDRNYWDTFCMASRSVLEAIPYAPTTRGSGFGPEDWHWATETLHAGHPHVKAPGTYLAYRVKPESINTAHLSGRSVLPRTPLLTDPEIGAAALRQDRPGQRHTRPRGLQRDILRQRRGKTSPPERPAPLGRNAARGLTVHPEHVRYLYPETAALTDAQITARFRKPDSDFIGVISRAQWEALAPHRFDVQHYRAINAVALELSNDEARRHYLQVGLASGLRARLTPGEMRDVARLELDDYRTLHADLAQHSDLGLLQHFLEYGREEGRRTFLVQDERRTVPDQTGASEEWRELHEIDPWFPVPDKSSLNSLRSIGPPTDGNLTEASRLWWKVVTQLGERRPDVIFFAPWIRMGGGDILLARYANAVAEMSPGSNVLVVTTHDESSRAEWLDDVVTLIDLPAHHEWTKLTSDERQAFLAALVVQYGPLMVHSMNSPEFADALEHRSAALSASTRIFMSTFVIDRTPAGAMANHLLKRPSGYLDQVHGVIVDNHALVEQFHEIARYDRERFVVHHQPVELPEAPARVPREPAAPLRVMWAARFDHQKRLDVLADVAEACNAAGVRVEWHIYGAAVITQKGGTTERDVARLERQGATFHGSYSSIDELPLSETDAFLFTSQFEGVPLTLIDMLARRVPVVSPLVGGIGELLTPATGWPVAAFDDVDDYVAVLRTLAEEPEEVERRSQAAIDVLGTEFTWERFRAGLRELPGYLPPA